MAIFGSVSFVQVSIYAETVDVEIRSSKVIRVSDDYNYPPFSYLDENGQPAGLIST